MHFVDYMRRVKELENDLQSGRRTKSAVESDMNTLQKRWQQEAKKNIEQAGMQKRNDMSKINKAVEIRERMREEELNRKWNN